MSQQAMQSYGQQEFPVVRYLAQVLGTLRWTRDPRVHFALRSPDCGDSARACLQDGSRLAGATTALAAVEPATMYHDLRSDPLEVRRQWSPDCSLAISRLWLCRSFSGPVCRKNRILQSLRSSCR